MHLYIQRKWNKDVCVNASQCSNRNALWNSPLWRWHWYFYAKVYLEWGLDRYNCRYSMLNLKNQVAIGVFEIYNDLYIMIRGI